MNSDEEIRFDQYVVTSEGGELVIAQLSKETILPLAQIMAGVEQYDFIESMFYEGWIGTCPHWTGYLPIVTIPSGCRLGIDQLCFMIESVPEYN